MLLLCERINTEFKYWYAGGAKLDVLPYIDYISADGW
ncbi:hypothetical protein YPC_3749 [Yersinia pestis biovar Medievalis str. Harbin 35]|nr:hypothetical protein YPC_3749 [Yersinia pestis biovar Medievalis str. Harbin 35]EEO77861.1 hypothetical protein YP516_0713 [Yersinia pestis Nepal516]EEO79188.1 hypothetical protein YPF_4111 [Yersinia pestis biovar Orientalis str. India 195]EEO85470.1 hypothetical protein YPH_1331 [Yersinia pestis biovar Orientalis str. PEXU2]EEO88641.1 hypothetical protein YPS_4367 [Yersinia pestis Pestoides A]